MFNLKRMGVASINLPDDKKCVDCERVFSKAEAQLFTICDTCWDKTYKGASPTGDAERAKAHEIMREAHYRGLTPNEYRRMLANSKMIGDVQ